MGRSVCIGSKRQFQWPPSAVMIGRKIRRNALTQAIFRSRLGRALINGVYTYM
jgi:hypothetical protein